MELADVTNEIQPVAFNARGAARYINLSEASIWKLAAEKKIEVRRRANRTFFIRASCDAYLAGLPSNLDNDAYPDAKTKDKIVAKQDDSDGKASSAA